MLKMQKKKKIQKKKKLKQKQNQSQAIFLQDLPSVVVISDAGNVKT